MVGLMRHELHNALQNVGRLGPCGGSTPVPSASACQWRHAAQRADSVDQACHEDLSEQTDDRHRSAYKGTRSALRGQLGVWQGRCPPQTSQTQAREGRRMAGVGAPKG